MSKRIQCQLCPKTYQSQNDLNKHYETYHNMKGKVVIIDDNPLSIAGWMEEHRVSSENSTMREGKV